MLNFGLANFGIVLFLLHSSRNFGLQSIFATRRLSFSNLLVLRIGSSPYFPRITVNMIRANSLIMKVITGRDIVLIQEEHHQLVSLSNISSVKLLPSSVTG